MRIIETNQKIHSIRYDLDEFQQASSMRNKIKSLREVGLYMVRTLLGGTLCYIVTTYHNTANEIEKTHAESRVTRLIKPQDNHRIMLSLYGKGRIVFYDNLMSDSARFAYNVFEDLRHMLEKSKRVHVTTLNRTYGKMILLVQTIHNDRIRDISAKVALVLGCDHKLASKDCTVYGLEWSSYRDILSMIQYLNLALYGKTDIITY
jgi:hypothetical protein